MQTRSIWKTRDEAVASGATRYYTGQLCKNGHDAERYTVNGGCVDCVNRKYVKVRDRTCARDRAVMLRFPGSDSNRPVEVLEAARVTTYLQAVLDHTYTKDVRTRLPLVDTHRWSPGDVLQRLPEIRAMGLSDSLILAMSPQRFVLGTWVSVTSKLGGLPVAKYRSRGWSDAQLEDAGYIFAVAAEDAERAQRLEDSGVGISADTTPGT